MMRKMAKYLLALVAAVSSLGAWAGTVVYYHNDIAGSPVVATDESRNVLWRESYRPYGERLTNAPASVGNRIWFTSRRQDAETGLVYMGARYYDPVVGRFISKDPVGFDEVNLHSHNRYAYANNNPYRFKDPNGLWAEDLVLAVPSLVLGAVSFQDNLNKGQYLASAVDVAGIIADGIAAVIPGVPGGVGLAIGMTRKTSDTAGDLIYRAASGTPDSMTPRLVDKDGLSAANNLANALPGKNQVIDTAKLKNLCAVCDNPATGHVSIRPKDASQMQGWMDSRGSGGVHPLTKELMDSVVDVVRK